MSDYIIQRWKFSLVKKKEEETPYKMPKFIHIRAIWTKFNTFYFQLFKKKEEEIG